jgi:DNA-binding NarL/FixJ family response regulator
VQKIKVLVANRPRLLRELVISTLANHRDIEVLNDAAAAEELMEDHVVPSIESLQPDFLITTLESIEPSKQCDFLLKRFPELQIIAVAPHSDSCVLYAMNQRIYSVPVAMSEQGILDALHGKTKAASECTSGPLRRVS